MVPGSDTPPQRKVFFPLHAFPGDLESLIPPEFPRGYPISTTLRDVACYFFTYGQLWRRWLPTAERAILQYISFMSLWRLLFVDL